MPGGKVCDKPQEQNANTTSSLPCFLISPNMGLSRSRKNSLSGGHDFGVCCTWPGQKFHSCLLIIIHSHSQFYDEVENFIINSWSDPCFSNYAWPMSLCCMIEPSENARVRVLSNVREMFSENLGFQVLFSLILSSQLTLTSSVTLDSSEHADVDQSLLHSVFYTWVF